MFGTADQAQSYSLKRLTKHVEVGSLTGDRPPGTLEGHRSGLRCLSLLVFTLAAVVLKPKEMFLRIKPMKVCSLPFRSLFKLQKSQLSAIIVQPQLIQYPNSPGKSL